MKFQVSDKFKMHGRRKKVFVAILFVMVMIGFVWMFIDSASTTDKVISVVGMFFLLKYLPHIYRNIKNNDSSYPEVEILESENKIHILYKGAVVGIPLSDIENLVIQGNKNSVKSILLTTKSFSNLRFEGYDNLDKLAELLKKNTPEGKVKNATWFHR